ncbi:MAG TPA: DNA polymerase III subunit gamma/tau [Pyrinomonadaceae bacterium]|nr:DNA polymerase III subunit gamma/tau [Pyrinomonadaceae bacterium]
MSYQVIARKWRPQTFEEVTGQEHITRTLRNAVEHERLHHAYLFSGARGVGKTTTARLLAKAVNCHKSDRPTPTPCRSSDPAACPSCREIAEGRSIDVLEIDAASNTGVDNVRDAIINTIGVRAARDRYKVFIIDEVHMLSTPAFNALLKTLEEPPPRVLFIMATTHAHKVPETILSRSQQFEFRTIAASKIAERLRLIADAEKIDVSDDALREVARAGEGSMRDAQSAFDQVISFSEGRIEAADVEAALGLAGTELLSRVMRAVADAKPAEALAVVDDLVARGHDLRNFCRDLLAHLRGLLVVKVAGDSSPLADITEAERRELSAEARDFSESDIVRFFHSLTETEARLRESAHPRYQLEIGLVKLIEMRRLAPLSQIVERLGALEAALRNGGGTGSPGAQTPPASAPAAGTPSRAGGRGGGAASFSAAEPGPQPQAPSASAPARTSAETFNAPPSIAAAPPSATAPAPSNFGAGRAATASTPNLKLVPPSSGGARTSDVPFPVAGPEGPPEPLSFFEEVRAGEDRVGQPVSLRPASAPSPAGATASGPARGGAREAQADDAASRIKRGLEERSKPLLAAAVDGARRVLTEGEEVYVEFAPDTKHLRDTLSRPENMRLLREACCQALGRQVGVRVEVRVPGESDDVPLTRQDEERLEQQRLREFAENHPLVQKVLKTFRAEIIEVKRIDGGQQQQ